MRWLTEAEKATILTAWAATLAAERPEGDQPGRGFPDPEMIQWCEALNRIQGVCTIQSCAGHNHPDGSRTTGEVWLRLDSRMARRFYDRSFELAAHPNMERVGVLFGSWGEEVATVAFKGLESDLLCESMSAIVSFLTELDRAS